MQKWFGKTKIDEASDAWKSFKDMKRSKEEPIDEFLLKFETVESKLKCSAVELPNLILALQLLESVDVTSDQRRSILVHVKIENLDTVYEDMKSSLRLLKGNLVEGNNKQNETDDEVNFSRNDSFRRSRSKSKQRFEDRSFDRTFDKPRKRPETSNSRDRGRSRERNYSQDRGSYRRNSFNKDYSRDRNNKGRDSSFNRNRDYSKDRYNRGRKRKMSYESVNLIFKETDKNWIKTYLEFLSDEEKEKIKTEPEERFFRFGNSARYPSKEEVKIPLKLGKLETFLNISLVDFHF